MVTIHKTEKVEYRFNPEPGLNFSLKVENDEKYKLTVNDTVFQTIDLSKDQFQYLKQFINEVKLLNK
jgi:hypothetical protein